VKRAPAKRRANTAGNALPGKRAAGSPPPPQQ
jgi:hypothetical protein